MARKVIALLCASFCIGGPLPAPARADGGGIPPALPLETTQPPQAAAPAAPTAPKRDEWKNWYKIKQPSLCAEGREPFCKKDDCEFPWRATRPTWYLRGGRVWQGESITSVNPQAASPVKVPVFCWKQDDIKNETIKEGEQEVRIAKVAAVPSTFQLMGKSERGPWYSAFELRRKLVAVPAAGGAEQDVEFDESWTAPEGAVEVAGAAAAQAPQAPQGPQAPQAPQGPQAPQAPQGPQAELDDFGNWNKIRTPAACADGRTGYCKKSECEAGGKLFTGGGDPKIYCWKNEDYKELAPVRVADAEKKHIEISARASASTLKVADGKLVAASTGEGGETTTQVAFDTAWARDPHFITVKLAGDVPGPQGPTQPTTPGEENQPGQRLDARFTFDQHKAILGTIFALKPEEKTKYDADNEKAGAEKKPASDAIHARWRQVMIEFAKEYVRTEQRDGTTGGTWGRLTPVEQKYMESHPKIQPLLDKIKEGMAALDRPDARPAGGAANPSDALIRDIRTRLKADLNAFVVSEPNNIQVPEKLVEWAQAFAAPPQTTGEPTAPARTGEEALKRLVSDEVERAVAAYLLKKRRFNPQELIAAANGDEAAKTAMTGRLKEAVFRDLFEVFSKANFEQENWLGNQRADLKEFLAQKSGNLTTPAKPLFQSDLLKYYCKPDIISRHKTEAGSRQRAAGPRATTAANANTRADLAHARNLTANMTLQVDQNTRLAYDPNVEQAATAASGWFDNTAQLENACKAPGSTTTTTPPGTTGPATPGQPIVRREPPPVTGVNRDEGAPPAPPKDDFSDLYRTMGGAALGAVAFGLFAWAVGAAILGPFGIVIFAGMGAALGATAVFLNLHPIGK